MSLSGLAGVCGVSSTSLEELTKGRAGPGPAGQIGVSSTSLQSFINGQTSPGFAGELGISSTTLQELRLKIGKEGAAGFIIGVMAGRGSA